MCLILRWECGLVCAVFEEGLDCRAGFWLGGVLCVCIGRTGICVPLIIVMGSFLLADELLIHDFFELDHFGGVVWEVLVGVRRIEGAVGDGKCGGACDVVVTFASWRGGLP